MKFLFVFISALSTALLQPATPQQAVDELLAADRAFSAAGSGKANVVDALTPMFAADVIMPQPGGKFARGLDGAIAALKLNADNTTAAVDWTPIRGGIAADGTQGFTFGYMSLHRPDGTTIPLKYMSYWVKSSAGWRVAAYKRGRRAEGAVSMELMPPSLPPALVSPKRSGEAGAEAEAEVAAAEKSFSDESQTIGLAPAFLKFGAADAVNMGPAATYVVGNAKISESVAGGAPAGPSPLHWAADEKVIAASSGDLGVSIGYIRQNAPGSEGGNPFFTIWRKVNGVWKYIAE